MKILSTCVSLLSSLYESCFKRLRVFFSLWIASFSVLPELVEGFLGRLRCRGTYNTSHVNPSTSLREDGETSTCVSHILLWPALGRVHINILSLWAVTLSLFASLSINAHVQLHTHPIDATHTALTLEFDLDEYDGVYEQYLHISTDSPAIKLSALHYPSEPITKYVESFKESKSLFMGPCAITGLLEETGTIDDDASLYVTYQLYSEKHPRTVAFPLHHKTIKPLATTLDTQGEVKTTTSSSVPHNSAKQNLETLETLKEPSPAPYINPLFLSLLCAILGLFLLARASYSAQCTWRSTLSIFGMALLATSIVVGAKAYQDRYEHKITKTTYAT